MAKTGVVDNSCGKPVGLLLLCSLLVLPQRLAQGSAKIDAQGIRQQGDDEEDITELISNRASLVFRREWLVAEPKVELASQLTDFFGETGILRQWRPVASAFSDPAIEKNLDCREVRWNSGIVRSHA